jgi:hypothetical protein
VWKQLKKANDDIMMAMMMKKADELTMEVAMVVMIMIVMTVKEVGSNED